MARGDQLGRQWRIIQTLITSKMGKSAAELAEEIECHPRTVYRDLEALQVAGFPIYTHKVDGKNLWALLDTVKHEIPIPFSLPELMALHFGSDMMKVFRGTVFYDSLESLFQKVKTTLPPESKKFIDGVEQTLHIGMKPHNKYSKFKEILKQINDAAVQKKTIEIVYYTMSRQKESKRKVDPYKIWFFNGTFYVVGFCQKTGEVRVFSIDRIKVLHLTNEAFEVQEDFDFEDFVRPSFGVFQGEPTNVKAWFSPDVAGYIKEKIWHDNQQIHPQVDGSIVFEAEVAGCHARSFP
jgi:predicted DNA-binding transcriptional regulator YafY